MIYGEQTDILNAYLHKILFMDCFYKKLYFSRNTIMEKVIYKGKEAFVKPEIQVILFEGGADVVTNSENWGEWDWNKP